MKREDGIIEDGVQKLVGAICGTLVVADEGWADTIPDWIKEQVKLERLLSNLKPETGMCTDAEATAYLYTLSLTRPMTPEACQIYFYLCGKYFKQRGATVPSDVPIPDTLTPEQQRSLDKLKQWIYKQRSQREKERFKRKKGVVVEGV